MPADKRSQPSHAADMLSNQVILDWNNAAFLAEGGATLQHALLAVRSDAMVHIAMHDAINAVNPLYESYALHQQQAAGDPIAAAATAAHRVLLALWPDNAAMLNAQLDASISGIPAGAEKTNGIAAGIAAANATLALRASDGAYQNPISFIPVSTVPGVYNSVPPNLFVFAEFWKTMPLFSLSSHDQFRSPPPPALHTGAYANGFNEVKAYGEANSAVRSQDQTDYARWWYEFSNIGWNRIARIKAAGSSLGLYNTARMFALLNMAMADSYTAGWDSKFFYNFWRPYTAIQAAANDGNNKTEPDPNWVSEMITPPIPDYPSTHSTLGNAAATVLIQFFGENSGFTSISTTSVPANMPRTFKSLMQAADENANSRVMAGIHFPFACKAGQKMGDQIGKWTVQHHLERLK